MITGGGTELPTELATVPVPDQVPRDDLHCGVGLGLAAGRGDACVVGFGATVVGVGFALGLGLGDDIALAKGLGLGDTNDASESPRLGGLWRSLKLMAA
jgi:hypothetical protein